jgi:hypothetical protein
VLLNIHVKRIVVAAILIAKLANAPMFMFKSKKSGRWNKVQGALRIRLDIRALYFDCNLGKAKPRQASS